MGDTDLGVGGGFGWAPGECVGRVCRVSCSVDSRFS